jgi:hypothetical protein
MTDNAIIPAKVANLLALKGQIVTLCTKRDCKVRKGSPMVEKVAKFQCRVGVNYDNMASVQEKRENGTLPAENAGLPWGQWLIFPHLIAHKGNHYLRCTTLNNNNVPQVSYLLDGREISREEARALCLASEFRDHEDNDCFTVKVESVTHVNGEAV